MFKGTDSALNPSGKCPGSDGSTLERALEPLDQWLTQTAAGDRIAFRNLYDETSGILFAQAIAMLRRRDTAEEALQEAYLRIWKVARLYDATRGPALPWLKRLLRNVVIDRLRSERQSALQCNYEDYARELPAPANPVDDRLDLAHVLAGLSNEQRSAITAVVVEGWTSEQLGRYNGMPTATAKARVARGLKKLRTRLGQGDSDWPELKPLRTAPSA
jgi:RNA polymerase sigma-70 factor (ECF subfamily)